jgi:hypothetical protein
MGWSGCRIAFLLLAATMGGIAWTMEAQRRAKKPAAPRRRRRGIQDVSWNDVAPVDTLGPRSATPHPLVDQSQDGELLRRIRPAQVRAGDRLLPPRYTSGTTCSTAGAYRVTLGSVEISSHGGSRHVSGDQPGRVSTKYAAQPPSIRRSGCPRWIAADARKARRRLHRGRRQHRWRDLSQLMAPTPPVSAPGLQQLLDHLARRRPAGRGRGARLLPLAGLQQVPQNLLDEGVHVRDMRHHRSGGGARATDARS